MVYHFLNVSEDVPTYKFQTKYAWYEEDGEFNSGESIVDPSGYIPAKARIENLIRAGEQLDSYRRELYHYGGDDEDDGQFMDPMNSPGLDPADVSRLNREAMQRLRTQQAAETVKESVDSTNEVKAEPKDPNRQAESLAVEADPKPSKTS